LFVYFAQVQNDKHGSTTGEMSGGGRLVSGNPTPPMTPPISAGQQLPTSSTAPIISHQEDLRHMMGQHHPLTKPGTSGKTSHTTQTITFLYLFLDPFFDLHSFRRTEGRTDGQRDGQREGQTDRGSDRWTEGRTGRQRDGGTDGGTDGLRGGRT
jgi:hypothetical protein